MLRSIHPRLTLDLLAAGRTNEQQDHVQRNDCGSDKAAQRPRPAQKPARQAIEPGVVARVIRFSETPFSVEAAATV